MRTGNFVTQHYTESNSIPHGVSAKRSTLGHILLKKENQIQSILFSSALSTLTISKNGPSHPLRKDEERVNINVNVGRWRRVRIFEFQPICLTSHFRRCYYPRIPRYTQIERVGCKYAKIIGFPKGVGHVVLCRSGLKFLVGRFMGSTVITLSKHAKRNAPSRFEIVLSAE